MTSKPSFRVPGLGLAHRVRRGLMNRALVRWHRSGEPVATGASQTVRGIRRAVVGGRLARACRERRASRDGARPARAMIVSAGVPPSWSGQAVALDRVLRGVDPSRYSFCQSAPDHRVSDTATSQHRHPVAYHELPSNPFDINESLSARGGLGRLHHMIREQAFELSRLLVEDGADVAVACTGPLLDPPAVRLACQKLGLPYVYYAFDDFESQWGDRDGSALTAELGGPLCRDAAAVVVANEGMAEAIQRRHGVLSVVVRNSCRPEAIDWIEQNAGREPASAPASPVFLYSGAVYYVNGKSLGVVARALDAVAPGRGRFVLRTAQSQAQVEEAGVRGACVQPRPHVAQAEIAAEQRSADVLVLALDSDPRSSAVARTAAPMKLADYLASGQPILAVVPADSFVARHLTEHRAAMVVTEQTVEAVSAAIDRLLADASLRRELVVNASRLATRLYDPCTNRTTLVRTLDAAHGAETE